MPSSNRLRLMQVAAAELNGNAGSAVVSAGGGEPAVVLPELAEGAFYCFGRGPAAPALILSRQLRPVAVI